MWFPEDQRINPVRNVTTDIDTFLLTLLFEESMFPKVPGTEDLTFIIPLGVDSHDRMQNVNLCVLSILSQTDAKVHIHWADTEENLLYVQNQYVAWSETGADPLIDVFKRTSGTGENIALIPVDEKDPDPRDRDRGTTDVAKILADMLILRAISHAQLSDSKTVAGWLCAQLPPEDRPPLVEQQGVRSLKIDKSGLDLLRDRVKVTTHLRAPDEPFHRTRYLNEMLKQTETTFVCNHDADILLPSFSICQSMAMLRYLSGVDFVYPYAHMNSMRSQVRVFLEGEGLQPAIIAAMTGDFTNILLQGNHMMWNAAYGQSIFARTSSYKEAGGECEEFVSWGAEDVERYFRFSKFGFGVARVNDGHVFHLEHARKADSGNSNPYFQANEKLWKELQVMTQKDLLHWFSKKDWVKEHKFPLSLKRVLP